MVECRREAYIKLNGVFFSDKFAIGVYNFQRTLVALVAQVVYVQLRQVACFALIVEFCAHFGFALAGSKQCGKPHEGWQCYL